MYKNIFKREYFELIVILIFIFVIRSIVIEPFRIPSGSMKPTLLVGDFIFANKFSYQINIPFTSKFIDITSPLGGDIIIFY